MNEESNSVPKKPDIEMIILNTINLPPNQLKHMFI